MPLSRMLRAPRRPAGEATLPSPNFPLATLRVQSSLACTLRRPRCIKVIFSVSPSWEAMVTGRDGPMREGAMIQGRYHRFVVVSVIAGLILAGCGLRPRALERIAAIGLDLPEGCRH